MPAPLELPRVVFGSSALGNLFEAPPQERKLAIAREWFAGSSNNGAPVVIDSAGKYGAGLALESIGRCLREIGVAPKDVVISNKLGWLRTPLTGPEPTFEPGAWINLEHDAEQRISREGILDCWRQGSELLGEPYRAQLLSVHDPDDYLDAAADDADRGRRWGDILGAYESLAELRDRGECRAIGVGAKQWRVAKQVADAVPLDWVMIANSLTVYTHPPELLAWLDSLAERGVAVINSAVFNAGFLVGGRYFDYRELTGDSPGDREKFEWRDRFTSLCEQHGVKPAEVCVRFGLSHPAVKAVALNTSKPERVAQCVALAEADIPAAFWADAKQAGLVAADYAYL